MNLQGMQMEDSALFELALNLPYRLPFLQRLPYDLRAFTSIVHE
jgi:hypothetical protein